MLFLPLRASCDYKILLLLTGFFLHVLNIPVLGRLLIFVKKREKTGKIKRVLE